MSRVVGWVSGGAASAVACKLAMAQFGQDRVDLIYIDTGSEHPDTMRFLADLTRWFNAPIQTVRSEKYKDTWEVWAKRRFLRGPKGAPCTAELKRNVRGDMAIPTDVIQVWGYTSEEVSRAEMFRKHHHGEMIFSMPLIEQGITKSDCYAMVERAGIDLPAPYLMGFDNNNCIPCVKAEGAKYWNRIRRNFPDQFARMAQMERELGHALCRITVNGERVAVFLDELDPAAGADDDTPEPFSCGITCFIAEQNIADAMMEARK